MPFGFLQKADPQNILSFIIDSHPQHAHFVSRVAPFRSSWRDDLSGIASAKADLRHQENCRDGANESRAITEIENALSTRMSMFMSQSFQKAGGVPAVAEILNVSDRATERNILESLARDSAELVEEIRRLMFVFEDLSKLADKDIQTVLKNVETNQWAMALKGASQPLQEKIMKNMSQRAARGASRRNGHFLVE